MKKYIAPTIFVIALAPVTAITGSTDINNQKGNGVQFTKERSDESKSDDWSDGLW